MIDTNKIFRGDLMLQFLKNEGVSPSIIADVERFRAAFSVEESLRQRIPVPRYLYYGKEIWEEAITALLCGENLLLVGPKATGKNVLAENLAAVFGRPSWDVSFYINTDAATLLATLAPLKVAPSAEAEPPPREPSSSFWPLKLEESAIRSISVFRASTSFCRLARSTSLS